MNRREFFLASAVAGTAGIGAPGSGRPSPGAENQSSLRQRWKCLSWACACACTFPRGVTDSTNGLYSG